MPWTINAAPTGGRVGWEGKAHVAESALRTEGLAVWGQRDSADTEIGMPERLLRGLAVASVDSDGAVRRRDEMDAATDLLAEVQRHRQRGAGRVGNDSEGSSRGRELEMLQGVLSGYVARRYRGCSQKVRIAGPMPAYPGHA